MKRGAALQIALEGALCIRRLANAFRQSLTAPGSLFLHRHGDADSLRN